MQNVILSLRKIFDNLVLIDLDISHINVSMQHAMLFFPTLNTSKSCFVHNKMVLCYFCLCLSRQKCAFCTSSASNTFKLLALLQIKITGLSIHSFVKNIIKTIQGQNDACSIYIYMEKLVFNKAKK
jgi:hypothetical protein